MSATSSHRNIPVPSLPRWPLLGNIFALRNERLRLLLQISQHYGDMGAFHFGPRIVAVVNSPDLIRQVLVEQGSAFEKTTTVRALGTPVLGNSIFLSEGEEHRRQRKLLAPLFHQQRVPGYVDTVMSCASRFLDRWKGGETLDLADEMKRLTRCILSYILFGTDVSDEDPGLSDALTCIFQHFAAALTNPFCLSLSWPTPQNRRVQQALIHVQATISRMIERGRQHEERQSDVLSVLLQVQREEQETSLRDRQIHNEALSLFVAGHETVANALTWCWYLLAQHPDICAKVQAESDRVLASTLRH